MPDPKWLKNRAAKVQAKFGLSDEVVAIIQRAAYNSYDECASDMVPDFRKRSTVRRSTAMEVALDAGRPQKHIIRSGPLEGPRWMAAMFLNSDRSYQDLIDLVGPAFPCSEYEVGI